MNCMVYLPSRTAGPPVATKIMSVDMAPVNLLYSASRRGFGKQSRAKQEKKNRPKLVQKKIPFEPSVAIHRDDGQWYLPAGTLVKHGTTTNNLRSIMDMGILAGDQSKGRSKNRSEPEVQQGVYAASCYLAYVASTFNLMQTYMEKFERDVFSDLDTFQKIASTREENLKLRQDLAQTMLVYGDHDFRQDCGFPSVLNIVLQEDVIIRADEDFLDKSRKAEENVLTGAAGFVWEQFGSCVLLVDKVPANWIKSVELVEADHRTPFWELMLFLVSENPVLELAEATVRKKLLNAERQFDDNKLNSRMRFEQDVKKITFSRSLAHRYQVEARKLWYDKVVQQLKRSNVFSQDVPRESVFGVLDELEKDERRFLATYFSLCTALTIQFHISP
jgi:hypothetical protein